MQVRIMRFKDDDDYNAQFMISIPLRGEILFQEAALIQRPYAQYDNEYDRVVHEDDPAPRTELVLLGDNHMARSVVEEFGLMRRLSVAARKLEVYESVVVSTKAALPPRQVVR